MLPYGHSACLPAHPDASMFLGFYPSSYLKHCNKQLRRSMSDVTENFKIEDDKELEFRQDIEMQMLDRYMPNVNACILKSHFKR
jgi:hypothetical protein